MHLLERSEQSEPLSSAGDESFGSLLRAAQAGSREASGQLFEQFRPYLLLIANQDLGAQTQGKVGASDVVQDAMLSAQRTIDDFRGQTAEELRGWLRRILLNDVLQTRRRYRETDKRQISREVTFDNRPGLDRASADPPCPQMTPSAWVMAQEEAETLRRAMSQMPPEHQQVLHLRNWQDLPFAEIGTQMNRSSEAARKLWSRAVVQLQRNLSRHESTSPSDE
jgi:RNA polymerase sigma-70 factor (ECF subfamily)